MRARYSAFVVGDEAYLLASWHPATRPASLSGEATDPAVKWLGLKIVAVENGEASQTRGVVEFIARYKIQGRAFRMHERSRFRKEDGQWFYVEGDQL